MAEEQVAEAPVDAGQAPSESVAQTETSWRDTLPEEIREHKSLSTIPDVGALAKSFVHAESMIGSDKIPVPGKWATDDDWSAVYSKLGRPETSGDYKLEAGETADADTLTWFKDTAHKVGLNSGQAQKLLSEYEERMGSQVTGNDAGLELARTEADLDLKREWGRAYDNKMAGAKSVLMNFADEDLAEKTLADGTKFGDHPDVVRLFSKVGDFIREKIGEDSIAGPKGNGVMAPDEASQKRNEITKEGSPYWDVRHPEHDWYVQEALKYNEMMV